MARCDPLDLTDRGGVKSSLPTRRRDRASASTTRVAILRLVRAAPDGLTASDVATNVGLHAATARTHLDQLARVGLLTRSRADIRARGRPAWLYRCDAPRPTPSLYRSLTAAILAHLTAEDGSPARVGESWGRRLARDAAGADPVDTVVRVLHGLGFAPHVLGDKSDAGAVAVNLPACPFADLVASSAGPTCALHLGLIRGVLAGAGSPTADAAVLAPLRTASGCVAWLPDT